MNKRDIVDRLREQATILEANGRGGDYLNEAAEEVARLRNAVAFARSAIRGREPWSDTCEDILTLRPKKPTARKP